MPRNRKNDIAIENVDGWIRLRWQYQGKRCTMRLGLPYEPINLVVAQQRAGQIKLDILSGHYDPTLAKYRSGAKSTTAPRMGAAELFGRFIEYKAKTLHNQSLNKHRSLAIWLKEVFGDDPADPQEAERFIDRLLENMEPVTAKERLVLLRAAWKWGERQGLVSGNPWAELQVKRPPKQVPRPFTKAEATSIIAGFEESTRYRRYADYVRFRFGTGCRTGEVNGLRWRHLNYDCSVVWFGESYTHGEFKDTKTGKAREVKLSPTMAAILRDRMPAHVEGDDLVFTALKGGPINDRWFCIRPWSRVLKAQSIPFRKPYNTRHTFISHALEAGLSPVEVAAITGHNVKTLFEHYAGLIKSHPTTPDLF